MRTRARRLAGGAAVAALMGGMSITGMSSAQAASVSSAPACCSFRSQFSEADALQQMRDFAANNHTTCTFLSTTVWEDPLFGRTHVVSADCDWP